MFNGFTDQRMCLGSCFKCKNVYKLRKKLVEERKEKKERVDAIIGKNVLRKCERYEKLQGRRGLQCHFDPES